MKIKILNTVLFREDIRRNNWNSLIKNMKNQKSEEKNPQKAWGPSQWKYDWWSLGAYSVKNPQKAWGPNQWKYDWWSLGAYSVKILRRPRGQWKYDWWRLGPIQWKRSKWKHLKFTLRRTKTVWKNISNKIISQEINEILYRTQIP